MIRRIAIFALVGALSFSGMANPAEQALSSETSQPVPVTSMQFFTTLAVIAGVFVAIKLPYIMMKLGNVPAEVAAGTPKTCCGGHGHSHLHSH